MSESQKKPSPNPKVDAAAMVPKPGGAGGSNGAFIVHTKHTCDACYQTPLLGKRYTSSVHPNYDLCSKCYDEYSGPDIGLKEAVLIRDKKFSNEFVLKLKILSGDDEQIRRIKVHDIWDKSTSHLSFEKMVSIASTHTLSGDAASDATTNAKVFYIDEDGDKITITSDKELEDAFMQTLKKFPRRIPFRVTVSIPKQHESIKAHPFKARKAERMKVMKAISQSLGEDNFIHARHTCDGCSKTPIIGTRYHATKIPDFDLCTACYEKYEGEDLDFKPEINERDRHMQPRWLRKQLKSLEMPTKLAGMWTAANGDLSDFLKKVQETGASVESATVYHTSAPGEKSCFHYSTPCQSFSSAGAGAGPKSKESSKTGEPEELLTAKCAWAESSSPKAQVDAASAAPAKTESGVQTDEKAPPSPAVSHDESFLSDADGNGSIAEAIGRTLDVCVAAIEEAMVDEADKAGVASSNSAEEKTQKPNNHNIEDDVAAVAVVAADAFSVASSMVSSMTDILKKMDDAAKKLDDNSPGIVSESDEACGDDNDAAAASNNVPSVVSGATILKSDEGDKKNEEVAPKVEDASEDEWSVVSDDKEAKPGKAATHEAEEEKSVSSVLSPVVLAKWDTELHQLHELSFLDDRKNVDVLEALEASHVAVDSTEKVTVQSAVERLLMMM